jgi:hypothetical protein
LASAVGCIRENDDAANQVTTIVCVNKLGKRAFELPIGPAFAFSPAIKRSGLASHGRGGYRVGSAFIRDCRLFLRERMSFRYAKGDIASCHVFLANLSEKSTSARLFSNRLV